MANIDISNLSNQMVTAQALSNLVLVWPEKVTGYQPQTQIYGGKVSNNEKFLFHYEGQQSVQLASDITDSYVESNYAIQDHIALRPEVITTTGFIGELNNVVEKMSGLAGAAADALQLAQNKLNIISAYAPQLSISGLKAYNAAFQAYQAAMILKSQSIKAWDTINNKEGVSANAIDTAQQGTAFAESVDFTTQNKQQVAFQKFYGYWKARTLFTVQTPWAIFKNCAIEEITTSQDEYTNLITSFSITFKPINVANPSFGLRKPEDYTGRSYFNAAPVQDSGMAAVDFSEETFNPSFQFLGE